MTLPKTSAKYREAYCNFMVALKEFSIVKGECVQSKRKVFEEYYSEGSDTAIALIISGHHPMFSLVPRDSYDESMLHQQLITDITHEVVTARAISMARRFSVTENFDVTVNLMAEAMIDALENSHTIESEIKKKKEQHSAPSS